MSAPLKFAVLGSPIAHSKSPAMHAAAYKYLGMPHTYEALLVAPEELEAAIDRLRSGEFAGFNVTLPHKERVLAFVDAVAPSAALAGAANTLVREPDGTLVAHNTDVAAIAGELHRCGDARSSEDNSEETSPSSIALVLGTGGAARAALAAFLQEPALGSRFGIATVVVAGRSLAAATALAAHFQGHVLRAPLERGKPMQDARLSFRAEALGGAASLARVHEAARTAIVIQATSAGLHTIENSGNSDGHALAASVLWDDLPRSSVALEMIYAPPVTPFLAAARAAGLSSVNGLGMLARQGALAFATWLSVPPPYEVMREALARA